MVRRLQSRLILWHPNTTLKPREEAPRRRFSRVLPSYVQVGTCRSRVIHLVIHQTMRLILLSSSPSALGMLWHDVAGMLGRRRTTRIESTRSVLLVHAAIRLYGTWYCTVRYRRIPGVRAREDTVRLYGKSDTVLVRYCTGTRTLRYALDNTRLPRTIKCVVPILSTSTHTHR